MKLSEAIKLGATKRPGCRYALFKDGASCALGAAYEGATGEVYMNSTDDFEKEYLDLDSLFPELMEVNVPHPNGALGLITNLHGAIVYKNDRLRQSREDIAEWVAGIGY